MDADQRHWQDLLLALDRWSSAEAVGDAQIRVEVRGQRRWVTVEISPAEWVDLFSVMWGSVEDALQDVKQTLLGLKVDQAYACYEDYRLVGSETARAAREPDLLDAGVAEGEWVAHGRDGEVHRFSDWPDESLR